LIPSDGTGKWRRKLRLEKSGSGGGITEARFEKLVVRLMIGSFGHSNLVLGSWFLVLGSWFLVLGAWFLVAYPCFFIAG